MAAKFKTGDIVVVEHWVGAKDSFVEAFGRGPFQVIHGYDLHLATMDGVQITHKLLYGHFSDGLVHFSPSHFRRDEFLTAVHRSKQRKINTKSTSRKDLHES